MVLLSEALELILNGCLLFRDLVAGWVHYEVEHLGWLFLQLFDFALHCVILVLLRQLWVQFEVLKLLCGVQSHFRLLLRPPFKLFRRLLILRRSLSEGPNITSVAWSSRRFLQYDVVVALLDLCKSLHSDVRLYFLLVMFDLALIIDVVHWSS